MFKPLRLVYLEAAPESKQESINSKNFVEKLRKFGYDKEKAKEAVLTGALRKKGGYKLTKAEALFEAGKLKTLADLENAAAESLDAGDVDDFLNKYGGDKYVKRLFDYGVSKMERDFMRKKQEFEADKKKGGSLEGLKRYATFEDAFNAGFYTELTPDFGSIMEKGLSVSEYRQHDERFKKLEKKVQRIEKEVQTEGEKLPPMASGKGKAEEQKVEAEKRVAQDQPGAEAGVKRKEGEKGLSKKAKEGREKENKLNSMLIALGDVGRKYRESDILIPALVEKYELDKITGELNITPLTENLENEDDYLAKFPEKIKIKKYVPGIGKTWLDFLDGGNDLSKEIVEELGAAYNDMLKERLKKLESLETALYVKGDGSSDPRTNIPEIEDEETRKNQEKIRLANIAAAENACPEIKEVQKLKVSLSGAVSRWKIEMIGLKAE